MEDLTSGRIRWKGFDRARIAPRTLGSTPAGYNEELDMKEYKFRFLTDLNTIQLEFEGGGLDIIKDYRVTDTEYNLPIYDKQTRDTFDMTYIGFNLKSSSCTEIGDQTLTEDETMSKGLAVRKAIAYLIDKIDIDNLLDIEISLADSPISSRFGTYVSTDINSYTSDLELAKEYMLKAGYNPSTIPSPSFGITLTLSTLFIISVIVIAKQNKHKKN